MSLPDTPTDDPDTVDMLAAEFVLGTLDRGARLDVEDRRAVDALLDERITWWERRLQPLALAVPVATPSLECQRRIVRRVRRRAAENASSVEANRPPPASSAASQMAVPPAADADDSAAASAQRKVTQASATSVDRASVTPIRSRRTEAEPAELSRWRALGIAASLTALALGVLLAGRVGLPRGAVQDMADAPPQSLPVQAAVQRTALSLLRDAAGQPRFIVEIRADDSVSITALNREPAPLDSSLQLWMADGVSGELRAVGLLPDEPWSSIELDDVALVDREPAFAVSVEPPGGSPQAGPTGEVVFQGTIHPIEDAR